MSLIWWPLVSPIVFNCSSLSSSFQTAGRWRREDGLSDPSRCAPAVLWHCSYCCQDSAVDGSAVGNGAVAHPHESVWSAFSRTSVTSAAQLPSGSSSGS
jgi:hypothetical protein